MPKNYPPNPKLGNWVQSQRKALKNGTLSEVRKSKLECLGFEWAPGSQTKLVNARTQWETNYSELVQFHQLNGHCHIPTDQKLNQWCSRQRLRKIVHGGGSSRRKKLPFWILSVLNGSRELQAKSGMKNLEHSRSTNENMEIVMCRRIMAIYWDCLLYTSPSPRD